MAKQMTKVRQALLLLLDAGFDHKEVAHLFGITEAQVKDFFLNDVVNEDRERVAFSDEREASIAFNMKPLWPHRQP